ncbi:hypothetical protein PCC7418_2544 [Halothece sp. PCC 7418]|uniref:glycosyltransferase family protein n=1 Tax=Halothece sp. (strain PCC 7418) TaxID=65093 RepID=UPI0002A061FA|nr:glycosyltransferase [Halothece sp. PCC 7418]AFZ44691.1 hypothetical protein PCC7418_2544 [Halothece sp. PCC 7418]
MKRLMFYCQHILGIGHLVRSMEIVRGLTDEFAVCFINGGAAIAGFDSPDGVEIVQLPPLTTDSEFTNLNLPEGFESLEAVFAVRSQQMIAALKRWQPDLLMVELFPFGRRRFSPELIPLIETARDQGTKVVSSLRDIVVTKQDQARHEAKVCKLMNRYFDLLLIHGDPQFMPLERSFTRVNDLECPVHYTGYVVPKQEPTSLQGSPSIVCSVGGGRFGHELLQAVAGASAELEQRIPHQIQMFTGPFAPASLYEELQNVAKSRSNLTVERYTPNLVSYLKQADLSINMGGYNTTLNVLQTGVRSLLLPFTGNGDQEQAIRAQRLEALGVVSVLRPQDLSPQHLAQRIVDYLQTRPTSIQFDCNGVTKTREILQEFAQTLRVA